MSNNRINALPNRTKQLPNLNNLVKKSTASNRTKQLENLRSELFKIFGLFGNPSGVFESNLRPKLANKNIRRENINQATRYSNEGNKLGVRFFPTYKSALVTLYRVKHPNSECSSLNNCNYTKTLLQSIKKNNASAAANMKKKIKIVNNRTRKLKLGQNLGQKSRMDFITKRLRFFSPYYKKSVL
jgi:hypothetical protein